VKGDIYEGLLSKSPAESPKGQTALEQFAAIAAELKR